MNAIDDLPPLRDVVDRFGLQPKKSLGQNFLFDLNLTSRIARDAGPLEGHQVIEVGPGPGGLTRALLAAGAERVIAVERDDRCIAALGEVQTRYPGRLVVVSADALQISLGDLVETHGIPDCPLRIIANLPYNVATPLFTNWLLPQRWPPIYKSMTLMFQKEVAQRICADTGDKAYGRLGVIAGWRLHREISFDVDPRNFTPPPKVMSSILSAVPNMDPLTCDPRNLERITQAAFGQRRKMLRASLKSFGGEGFVERAGIIPTKRAEELTVEEFVTLANLM